MSTSEYGIVRLPYVGVEHSRDSTPSTVQSSRNVCRCQNAPQLYALRGYVAEEITANPKKKIILLDFSRMASYSSKSKYSPVDSALETETEKLLDQIRCESQIRLPGTRSHWPSLAVVPWALAIAFASLSLFLFMNPQNASDRGLGTYEDGFTTDFLFSSEVPLERKRFTRSPEFYDNGTAWMPPVDYTSPWPENVNYVGEPSPEIDANWEQLIKGRYFLLTEQEAERAWGDKRHDYIHQELGGYVATFDMFHILHCLFMRPEYYARPDTQSVHGIIHTEHCLDSIRQIVQCYGGTTLIPTRYREGLGKNYIDSGQDHSIDSQKCGSYALCNM
ncbi:hypothetical protein BX600DRAFT_431648 [Xylariales sp. PMI_506]|nr:hypothetical protein BX600DRAFT_431648 [Xylariales sp. PMI_506]